MCMFAVKPEGEVEVYETAVGGEAQQHHWHWEIVIDVKSKHNNIENKTHSLTTYHFPAHPPYMHPIPTSLPLCFPHLCYYHPDHYQARSSLPPTWLWVGGGGGWGGRREDEDKRPNKVHLNIAAARPLFPCPYKELVVNPDGQSSSQHQELIPPSRTGTITAGAWKHTHTHMHTHKWAVMFY